MIQPVSSAASGLFVDVLRIRSLQGDRLAVPVRPIYSAYACFEHIRGIPAAHDGVPIFKLRVLDKLIDRLLSYGEPVPAADRLRSAKPETSDPVVRELEQRLQQHVTSRTPLFGGQFPETGMLIDLVA
jgi:hypothetical protein